MMASQNSVVLSREPPDVERETLAEAPDAMVRAQCLSRALWSSVRLRATFLDPATPILFACQSASVLVEEVSL